MLSWIGTRIFYAIVFFALGAWVASTSPGLKGLVRQASEASAQGFEELRGWTSSTLTPASVKEAEKPRAAAPVAAPVAADLLLNARAAYARKDIVGAINAYRDYIDRNPAAVDVRGELGNVYFAAGRLRDAAEVFFEAAVLKLNSGDVAGAKEIVAAVRQGDGALADDLVRRIAKDAPDKK